MNRHVVQSVMAVVVMTAMVFLNKPAMADDSAALRQQVQQLNSRIDQLEKQLAQKNNTGYVPQPGYADQYDPFQQMYMMQRAMDNMFDQSMGQSMPLMGQGFFNPRTDIKESPDKYTITMDLPGMDKNKIDVKVQDGTLVVSGERSSETQENSGGKVYRQERSFGNFMRAVPLPDDAMTNKIDASYKNGVLTVTVGRGKQNNANSQKITVK